MARKVLASRYASGRIAEEPNKSFAALQDRVMVKRTAPIRVITFLLLAAYGASCQKRPSADLLLGLQFGGSNSPEMQRQEMQPWRSLPDAPSSIQPPSQVQGFHTFVNRSEEHTSELQSL